MPEPGSAGRPAYRVYRMFWSAMDWLFPPNCVGCQKAGLRWCADCWLKIKRINENICEICGQPVKIESSRLCAACARSRPAYHQLRSWAVYEGSLRTALLRIKYKGDIGLGDILARELMALMGQLGWPVDLVTPAPLGVARKGERGYNQAAFIAYPFALATSLRYAPQALSKVRDTPSQVGLSMHERRLNVQGAYRANRRLVEGKTVLVIDDIATSGATMQACAEALNDAGVKQVFGLTVARASLN